MYWLAAIAHLQSRLAVELTDVGTVSADCRILDCELGRAVRTQVINEKVEDF